MLAIPFFKALMHLFNAFIVILISAAQSLKFFLLNMPIQQLSRFLESHIHTTNLTLKNWGHRCKQVENYKSKTNKTLQFIHNISVAS